MAIAQGLTQFTFNPDEAAMADASRSVAYALIKGLSENQIEDLVKTISGWTFSFSDNYHAGLMDLYVPYPENVPHQSSHEAVQPPAPPRILFM